MLTSQFIVPQEKCNPSTYETFRVVSPARTGYTSGTVAFADGSGNAIRSPIALDVNGEVDLSQLGLENANGLPQFIVTLQGAAAGELSVELTWTDQYDPDCVGPGTEVEAQATTITTRLSDGVQNDAAELTVEPGTPVTDTATVAGPNAGAASGTVTYTWYSDTACTTAASSGSARAITTPGTLPRSAPVTLAPGTYYPIASYSGDEGNLAGASACGDEVLTVNPPEHTLTVTPAGNGGGSVASSPPGIDCGATCSFDYDEGTSVELTATPNANSDFGGFTGCDSTPTETTCVVAMSGAKTVGATFTLKKRALSLLKTGNGNGTLDCGGSPCAADYDDGTEVTITGTPDENSILVGFTGCASTTATTCTVTMSDDRTVTANFILKQRTLSVAPPATAPARSPPTPGSTAGRTVRTATTTEPRSR